MYLSVRTSHQASLWSPSAPSSWRPTEPQQPPPVPRRCRSRLQRRCNRCDYPRQRHLGLPAQLPALLAQQVSFNTGVAVDFIVTGAQSIGRSNSRSLERSPMTIRNGSRSRRCRTGGRVVYQHRIGRRPRTGGLRSGIGGLPDPIRRQSGFRAATCRRGTGRAGPRTERRRWSTRSAIWQRSPRWSGGIAAEPWGRCPGEVCLGRSA